MPIRWNKLLIVLFFLVVNVSFYQEKNPTAYPYGGVPDRSRHIDWMKRIPLNFKTANFDSAQFDSLADFLAAQFHSQVDFRVAQFHSRADFGGANFDSLADFKSAKFGGRADFGWAQFHSLANFGGAQFDSINFDGSVIKDEILFGSNENRLIDFTNTNFIEDAKLVLYTPINFVIQPEKIKYISLKFRTF